MEQRKGSFPMRTNLLTAAALAAAALMTLVSANAQSPATPPTGSNAAKSFEPGKVGPGSENNAVISPTSPSIPINKQPPPEIPPNASSGNSTGEHGSGPEATTGPYNPSAPGVQ
jgi:hypothetical protein